MAEAGGHVGDTWEPQDDENAGGSASNEPALAGGGTLAGGEAPAAGEGLAAGGTLAGGGTPAGGEGLAAGEALAGGEALSAEQAATLKALRDTGMPLAELTARARRDVQTEQQGQQTRPQPVAAPAGAAGDAADPDSILTRAEAEKLIREAATTAEKTAVQASVQTRLQEVIDREIASTAGFGDLVPDDEVLLIKNRVGSILMAQVRFEQLSKGELDREVKRITTEVLADKRKEAQRISGAGQESEAQLRVRAQRESAPAGTRGSSGKRSAPTAAPPTAGSRVFDIDHPRYGMNVQFPSAAEIEAEKDGELDQFFAQQAVGR